MLVGITGGIGVGKTLGASFFSELNINTINADEVCKQIIDTNKEVFSKIVEHFGDKILNTNTANNNRKLNRNKLRKIIFEDITERKWLEKLLHPMVNQKMLIMAKSMDFPYCIIDSPLIIETKFHLSIDKIIVVTADKEKQIERIIKRNPNYTASDVEKIIDAQANEEEKIQFADFVIENNGTPKEFKAKIIELHKQLKK